MTVEGVYTSAAAFSRQTLGPVTFSLVFPLYCKLISANKMADKILGTYDLVESKDFDKYMEAIGVGFLMRKMANSTTSMQVEISQNGDDFTIKSISKLKTSEVKFKLNQETKETTMDGREVLSTFTLDGNTLTQVQKGIKDPSFVSTIERKFTSEGMVATLKHKDVVAVRTYKKI
ncbi:FABP6 [Ramazzottius varieornatus]|uniref:FABP6 n=1 Tax=Ramazzottius varieornatus TaxID=947166 RepID=A0A1D1VQ60_RAMVA|nr:FABP6 [Ramazzottius varieornatus]